MITEKLKNDFESLRDHCIVIRRDYNTYNDLYFSGNDEILVKTASTFFNDLAEILQRDWVLQVCKLMDPAETKRGNQVLENISIKLINSQLKEYGILSHEIEDVSKELFEYGKKLVPARHKRLAHFDREHHVKGITLGETTERELNGFLINIQKYCDLVGNSVGLGPLDFSSSGCPGDVQDLLSSLGSRDCKNA